MRQNTDQGLHCSNRNGAVVVVKLGELGMLTLVRAGVRLCGRVKTVALWGMDVWSF